MEKSQNSAFEPTKLKTKEEQYNEYLSYGGSMTIEEWEMDGRYDPSIEAALIKIMGYTPNYEKGFLTVSALLDDTNQERSFDIPFQGIAKLIYPLGNGEHVCIGIPYNPSVGELGFCMMQISPANFIADVLENINDEEISRVDKSPYVQMLNDAIVSILSVQMIIEG